MAPTGILYALVARGPVILAEFSSVQGNASVLALKILEKLDASTGDRMSYSIDNHVFHLLLANGIVYLCMSDQALGRRITFAFLEDVQQRFEAAHSAAAATAPAYALNAEFAPVLRERAEHHSSLRSDTITRVTGEVNSLREVMVDNIERVLERGERLELLVDRTDAMAENSFVFKRSAATLKRQMWWKSTRTTVYVVLLVLAALYALAAALCGPGLHCRS